jgi:hypothetical protein
MGPFLFELLISFASFVGLAVIPSVSLCWLFLAPEEARAGNVFEREAWSSGLSSLVVCWGQGRYGQNSTQ